MTLDPVTVSLIGIVITNVALVFSIYVTIKVQLAKLEVRVEVLFEHMKEDVNNLGKLYRNSHGGKG